MKRRIAYKVMQRADDGHQYPSETLARARRVWARDHRHILHAAVVFRDVVACAEKVSAAFGDMADALASVGRGLSQALEVSRDR